MCQVFKIHFSSICRVYLIFLKFLFYMGLPIWLKEVETRLFWDRCSHPVLWLSSFQRTPINTVVILLDRTSLWYCYLHECIPPGRFPLLTPLSVWPLSILSLLCSVFSSDSLFSATCHTSGWFPLLPYRPVYLQKRQTTINLSQSSFRGKTAFLKEPRCSPDSKRISCSL